MALITPGALAGEIRGSMGGIVFSRNRSSAYIRNRVVPVNPDTTRQATVRADLGAYSSFWATKLSQTQRDGWVQYAEGTPVTNKLGASIILTGLNMFVRANTVAGQAGLPEILDAPGTFGEAAPIVLFTPSANEAGQLFIIDFDNTEPWANEDDAACLVSLSKPHSPGVSRIFGPYRVAGAIPGDATTAPTSPQTFSSPWIISEGEAVKALARVIRADGRVSPIVSSTFLVGA